MQYVVNVVEIHICDIKLFFNLVSKKYFTTILKRAPKHSHIHYSKLFVCC